MKEFYKGLGHIAIHVRSMEESIAFYEKIGGAVLQQAVLPSPEGDKLLCLIDLGGVTLELLRFPGEHPMTEGNIPHFAIYVENLDGAAAALRAAGVDTFTTPEKTVLPHTFGGLQNWFFTGPSGEQIELLEML